MNKERYLAIFNWLKEKPYRLNTVKFLNKYIPAIFVIFYALTLITALVFYPVYLTGFILRPLLCFAFVSVLRAVLKFERPYDVYGFEPINSHHPGKNKSFPSRHTASALIIALIVRDLFPAAGLLLILLSLITGILRVFCGNHFIKDVVAAFLIALIFYFV